MNITPLDKWVYEKTGGDLPAYQLTKLNETLKIAQNGYFYRRTLPSSVSSLTQLSELPLIDAKTLTDYGTGLVCVPQSEISRIVTLSTSGTSGVPKRVYFSQSDQELTLDFFSHGLPTVTRPGGTMAILLPCERPGGVGDLIARALLRIPVTPVSYGPVTDLSDCAEALTNYAPLSLVGAPVQILNLARYCETRHITLNVQAVLLSTDNIPRVIIRELNRIWGCEVFEHYGMTETGLGGAIDCEAHNGYHIRENDLLFEVLDEHGNPVPDGKYGELVFTTLTRHAMPLIRYKTGDTAMLLPGRCVCGSGIRRLSPIAGRSGGDVLSRCGTVIRQREFDEVLFEFYQISDFSLAVSPERDFLTVNVNTQLSFGDISSAEIEKRLRDSGLLYGLAIKVNIMRRADNLPPHGAKRTVIIYT